MGFTKRALKCEQDGTPIGQPHKMYLDCECGHHLSIPTIAGMPMTYQCVCGREYNDQGWILQGPRIEVK